MAKLRIQAPNGKTLVVDVTGHNPAEYDGLATAAVQDYMQGQQSTAIPDDVRNEAGLEPDMLAGATPVLKEAGKMVTAGGSGIGDLVSGNGLQQAATDVEKVQNEEKPETTGGKVGEAIGSAFTPAQIAIGAGLGKAIEPIGSALADLFSGWSEQAARNAIGFVKNMANKGDISDLSTIARFVMNPVRIAGKMFPSILTKSSTPEQMLASAEAIQEAAGQALGGVSEAADTAIADNAASINLGAIDQNLAKLQSTVERNASNLGKPVVQQYEKAIDDFHGIIDNWKNDESTNLFTALRDFKTTIGGLMGEGDNVVASKAALQKVYGTLASELDAAAAKISPQLGAAYKEANQAYTYATDAVEALTNKIKGDGVKPLLPSIRDIFQGNVLNGSPALASGLRTASKAVGPVLGGIANAAPGAVQAILSGLQGE